MVCPVGTVTRTVSSSLSYAMSSVGQEYVALPLTTSMVANPLDELHSVRAWLRVRDVYPVAIEEAPPSFPAKDPVTETVPPVLGSLTPHSPTEFLTMLNPEY